MRHDLALSILRGNRNYEQKLWKLTSDKFIEAKAAKAETIKKLQESIDILKHDAMINGCTDGLTKQ